MPPNTGQAPEYALVDIQYRNGMKVRGIDPAKRRWSIADPKFGGESDFDIVRWQPAGERLPTATEQAA